MFSAGLVLAFAGMCLCQQQQQQQQTAGGSPTQYQQQQAVSQASFQTGSAAVPPQTKLEDIERDSLLASAYGQKTAASQQQQQPGAKLPSASAIPAVPQQQQAYQTAPQQQYYVQPYQTQQPQFYVQPYQPQPQYQMAFDYAGVQYMIINPNQMYQQYYVPAAPTPSAVPQYVTKQSSPAAAASTAAAAATTPAAQAQQATEYKQQQFAVPAAQAPQEYKFVVPASVQPAYQYVQQPAAAAAAAAVDYSFLTRHPAVPSTQFKAPAASAQPQYFQYTVPQQQPQYQQQPQFYYTLPGAPAQQVAAEQQAPQHVQQSAKSQFSSGVKSTTPTPYKESFAYKYESSPVPQKQQQQQQPGAAYSTLRYSA